MKRLVTIFVRSIFVFSIALSICSCSDVLSRFGDKAEEGEESEDALPRAEDRGGPVEPGSAQNSGRTYTQLRNEKRDLERRLKELGDLRQSHAALLAEEMVVTSQLDELRAYERDLVAFRAEVESALNAWRAQTRQSFVGVRLEEVVTIGGESYKGVEFLEVGDLSLKIRHEGGTSDLDIMQLPVGLRINLIHEPTVMAAGR